MKRNSKLFHEPLMLLAAFFILLMPVMRQLPDDVTDAEAPYLAFADYSYSQLDAFPEKIVSPLYPALTKICDVSFGRHINILRGLSLVFAMGVITLLFLFCARRFGLRIASFALIILVVHPFFVHTAMLVQPFTMALFFGLLTLYKFPDVSKNEKFGWGMILSGIACEFSFWPSAIFLLSAAIYGRKKLSSPSDKSATAALFIWLLIPVICLISALAVTGKGMLGSLFSNAALADPVSAISQIAPVVFQYAVNSIPSILFTIILVLLLITAFVRRAGSKGAALPERKLLILIFIACLIACIIGSVTQYFAFSGVFVMLLPILAVIAAIGGSLLPRFLGVALMVAFFLASFFVQIQSPVKTNSSKQLISSLYETMRPKNDVAIFPQGLMQRIFLVLPNDAGKPVLRPNGFFKNGAYQKSASTDRYTWHIAGGESDGPGAIVEKLSRQISGKGMLTLLHDPDIFAPLLAELKKKYAILSDDKQGMIVYFQGSKGALDSILPDKKLDELIANEKSPMIKVSDKGRDILKERIALAIQFIDRNLDCEKGCIPQSQIAFEKDAILTKHAGQDWCGTSTCYAKGLLDSNKILGKGLDNGRVNDLQKTLLGTLTMEGMAFRKDDEFSDVEGDVADQFNMILYLIEKFEATQNRKYLQLMTSIMDSLLRKRLPEKSGFTMPYPTLLPDGSQGIGKNNWQHVDPCLHAGQLLYPVALYLRHRPNDENAIYLFDGISDYILDSAGVFKDDGSFSGHTQSRIYTLLGMLLRGKDLNDKTLTAFARKHLIWLLENTPDWGWIPAVMPESKLNQAVELHGDIAALAATIEALLIMAKEDPAYWDMIDRYVQNGILKGQFTDRFKANEKAIGSFCSDCLPNSFGEKADDCATPAGVSIMAELYKAAVEKSGETIAINLLIGRDGPLVSVQSAQTMSKFSSRIKMKTDGELIVRIPDWVNPSLIEYGKNKPGKAEEGRISFGKLAAGEEVYFTYKPRLKVELFKLGDKTYRYQWVGHRVVQVEPEAARFQLFTRKD